MRQQRIRRLAVGAGLVAVVLLAAPIGVTAPLPESAASAVVAADIEFLQKGLEKTPEKRAVNTLKAAAMNVALTAPADVSKQALKVAEAIGKKDFAGAKDAAAKLTAASGPAAKVDAAKLAAAGKYDIGEVMSAFRITKVGGMNLEKDIKAYAKKVADPKAAELIGARTAALGEFTMVLPSEKATSNAANKKKWESYTADMNKAAAAIAKGGKGLEKQFQALDASCVACHNEFRD